MKRPKRLTSIVSDRKYIPRQSSMTMKKISRTFIPALALVLAVLTSCEPDSVSGGRLSSGKPFTFTIGNGSVSSTRGMESRPEVPASSLLCTLESTEEDGDAPTLSITQTVTSLDDEWLLTAEADGAASLTRGTPVFTENLGTFAANTYAPLSADGTYTSVWQGMANAEFTRGTDDKVNVWSHSYDNNEQWPDDNGNLTFFMRYPVSATSATNLPGLSYGHLAGQGTHGENVINLTGYSTPGAGNTTTAAEAQTDIVFATATLNEGNRNTNNKLLFYHPLCGVKFKIGTLFEGVTITGVTLSGVYSTGDCVITPYYGNEAAYGKTNSNTDGGASTKSDACVAWSNLATPSTFGQTFTSSDYNSTLDTSKFPSDFADAGTTKPNQNQLNTTTLSKTFNLIPQTFTDSHKLTMTIDFSVNGSPMQRSAELTSVTWQAGHLYTYAIGYDPYTYTFTLVGGETTGSQAFYNTTSTSSADIPLISTKSLGGEVTSVEWIIKSVQVGSASAQTINDNSFSGIGGLTAEATADGKLKLTAAARTSVRPGSNDYWTNNGGISGDSDGSGWSPADWSTTKATTSSPLDLSKFDPYTDTENAYDMTTANCYIIRHAGTYKLPLVYGNAVQSGNVYTDAYAPTMAAGGDSTKFLSPFQNCFGDGITNAFIENDGDCGGENLKCAIVWQDNAEVITNLRLSTDAADAGTVYNKDDVRYLVFDVPQGSICQNNALICIYKDGVDGTTGQYDPGEAVWSWHIWTTNDPALLSGPIPVTNFTNVEYDFFPLYNIGYISADSYPSRPDVKIVLQQQYSGNEIEISVSQLSIAGAKSSGCYYQFGRKDPTPSTTTNPVGFSVSQGPATLSSAIQNPGVFFKKYDNKNWCSEYYYNLWTGKKSTTGSIEQDDDMIKTIYDPSPVGYKLPASKAFTGFTDTGVNVASGVPTNCNVCGPFNHGWTFYTKPGKQGGTIYFPAAGYRHCANGTVTYLGDIGDYWTAVPADDYNANYLYTHSGYVAPLNGFDRAFGIMVRPVLEPEPSATVIGSDIQDYSGHSL